jgi:hypothetical protein
MARAVVAALVLCLALAGCGGGSSGGSSATTEGAGDVPAALTKAREARSCATLGEDLNCTYYDRIEEWFQDGEIDAANVAGAVLFVGNGCTTCHVYRDIGIANVAGPELTQVGAGRDAKMIAGMIVCPTCAGLAETMPSFKQLPKKSVDELAAFLAASS